MIYRFDRSIHLYWRSFNLLISVHRIVTLMIT